MNNLESEVKKYLHSKPKSSTEKLQILTQNIYSTPAIGR